MGPSFSLAARPSTRGPPPRLRGLRHNEIPREMLVPMQSRARTERPTSPRARRSFAKRETGRDWRARAGAKLFEKNHRARARRLALPLARARTNGTRSVRGGRQVTTGSRSPLPYHETPDTHARGVSSPWRVRGVRVCSTTRAKRAGYPSFLPPRPLFPGDVPRWRGHDRDRAVRRRRERVIPSIPDRINSVNSIEKKSFLSPRPSIPFVSLYLCV